MRIIFLILLQLIDLSFVLFASWWLAVNAHSLVHPNQKASGSLVPGFDDFFLNPLTIKYINMHKTTVTALPTLKNLRLLKEFY